MKLPPRTKSVLLILTILTTQTLSANTQLPTAHAAGSAWPDDWQADSAFYRVWSRADEPVAAGAATRSWIWGPVPFAVANEAYAESPTGHRLVEYVDKARIEVNDPLADRNSPWFVTSGLLVTEMVTGRMQTGNNRFELRPSADVPVAGDPEKGTPTEPLYSSFAQHTVPVPSSRGKVVTERIARDGTVGRLAIPNALLDPKLFSLTYYDDVSRHNVPNVFRDWMLQQGTVLENGSFVQGQLMDPLYLLGRPITEPYWADVPVGGTQTTVLMQLFERRALTYNPNNPPAWRVEMANVGRAYYAWRYSNNPPEPAISAEANRDGLQLRGWNWPPAAGIQVEIDLPGNPTPLLTPQSATASADGRFSLVMTATKELQDALQASPNLQVKAITQQSAAALPLNGKALGGRVLIEGTISEVARNADGNASMLMLARDGQEWTLSTNAGSVVRYSEGSSAPPGTIRAGTAVTVDGIATGNNLVVTEMRLLSLSSTGAHLSYTVQPDRKVVRVSGTGWPAEREVNVSLSAINSQPLSTNRAKTDSRGNLTASIPLPAANALPSGRAWLFVVAADGNTPLAQVAVPFGPVTNNTSGESPPQLFAISQAGEQKGNLGSYCWHNSCADAIGSSVPGSFLLVKAGQVLGLRSQYGPDPLNGLTPIALSAMIYAYDDPPGQVAQIEGTLYFTPKAPPVYATGTTSGKPFIVSIPQSLPTGKYTMFVQVGWPDPTGGNGKGSYGFSIQAP